MAMSGSDYFNPGLGSETGVPFVTVGSGPGFNYGPNTQAAGGGLTTTGGIQEAVTAFYNAVSPYYLLPIRIAPNYKPTCTTGITINSMNGQAGIAIMSDMYYSIQEAGTKPAPPAYLNFTNATGDCFQVYGQYTVGVLLSGLNILCNTTGNGIHFAGGERACMAQFCWVQNTNSTAGAYAIADDTAQGINGENNSFFRCIAKGGYGGIGIGTNEASGSPNDTVFYSCTTSGGTFGVNVLDGSQLTFINWYDRSNAGTASINLGGTAGRVILIGGESQNSTSYVYQVSVGTLELIARYDSPSASAWNLTGGSMICHSGSSSGSPGVTMAGGGLTISPLYNGSNLTLTGSTGTLNYYSNNIFGPPTISAFSGTVKDLTRASAVVGHELHQSVTGANAAFLTYPPPSGTGMSGTYRIGITMACSAATAATVGWTATWKDLNGGNRSPTNLAMFQLGVAAPFLTVVLAANTNYAGETIISIDSSGTNIVIAITFTGTSFTALVSAYVEQLVLGSP